MIRRESYTIREMAQAANVSIEFMRLTVIGFYDRQGYACPEYGFQTESEISSDKAKKMFRECGLDEALFNRYDIVKVLVVSSNATLTNRFSKNAPPNVTVFSAMRLEDVEARVTETGPDIVLFDVQAWHTNIGDMNENTRIVHELGIRLHTIPAMESAPEENIRSMLEHIAEQLHAMQ